MPSSRKLRFTPEANADIRELLQESLERWGESQQLEYAAALDAAFARLLDFPSIGRTRDELSPGLRSLPVEQHLVFYVARGEDVTVRRVIHQRRDLDQESWS